MVPSSQSPLAFLPALRFPRTEPGNRDHYGLNVKRGSMTMRSAPPLASGTIISRLQKSLSFLGRGRAHNPASNPGLARPGGAALAAACVISRASGSPSVKWGNPSTSPCAWSPHTCKAWLYLGAAPTARAALVWGWRLGLGGWEGKEQV